MKRILFLVLLLSQTLCAQTVWTEHSIPNTRTEIGNYIHVSDPDDYLSDTAELMINMALDSIRDQADVFVVTLYSIGDREPKDFATSLFNYWGIGDAETNNGVLLLFVEDQHALEFETGYGAEEILTDAHCSRIFNQTIVPYFREGDYEGGLCAGVVEIVSVYGGAIPAGLRSVVPVDDYDEEYEDYAEDDGEDMMDDFSAWFVLLGLFSVPILSFIRWIGDLLKRDKGKDNDMQQTYTISQKEGVNYIKNLKTSWTTSVWRKKGFLRFLLYGVSMPILYVLAFYFVPSWMPDATEVEQSRWATIVTLFTYLTGTCLVQNIMMMRSANRVAIGAKSPSDVYERARGDAHSTLMRVLAPWVGVFFAVAIRKKRDESSVFTCPECGHEMRRDNSYVLPPLRALEVQLGAYRYKPCRCETGHLALLRDKGPKSDKVHWCKNCEAKVARHVYERVLKNSTYTETGTMEITYECQKCRQRFVETMTIPKKTHYSSSTSSSGGSSRSSSGGGSFGGGRSGGGGYSGRW